MAYDAVQQQNSRNKNGKHKDKLLELSNKHISILKKKNYTSHTCITKMSSSKRNGIRTQPFDKLNNEKGYIFLNDGKFEYSNLSITCSLNNPSKKPNKETKLKLLENHRKIIENEQVRAPNNQRVFGRTWYCKRIFSITQKQERRCKIGKLSCITNYKMYCRHCQRL